MGPLERAWLPGWIWALALGVAHCAAQGQSDADVAAVRGADAAFHEGYAAQQNGNLELARAKFAEAVQLQPQIALAHEALGVVLLEMNRPAEAIAELESAAHLKPGDPGNEANLAMAYAAAGNAAQAIPHFDAAVQPQGGQAPQETAQFYDAYGRALAAVGRPDAAVTELMAEEKITGERANLEDAIGSLYAQQKDWDEARSRFERALALDGSMEVARIHLGVLLREQGDLAGSLTVLESAAQASTPGDAQASLEYGRTLVAAGRDADAVAQFEVAAKADAFGTDAAMELAMALQRLGRQDEAIPWFEKVVDKEPRNGTALTNLGLALTLTGKAKEGLDILQRAEALDANSATVYKDIGVAHVQLSAFDEAITDFEKALTLDGNDPQLHYDLGLAYKFKDRYEDAIRELSKAGAMDPTLQDPPYTLGILLMQIGRLDDAVVQLKKAVALRPESGDSWAILGSTLKQDARLPEAADALRKAIPLLPGQPGPRVTLAGVLAEEAANTGSQADAAEAAGDTTKAAELRTQMTALRTEAAGLRKEAAELARGAVNRQKANFAMNAGNQEMLRGQIAEAIGRYQEAIAADPTFGAPHEQLAIAYERQGRAEDAKAERAKAAELGKTGTRD